MSPLVSVIVPTHDRAEFLDDALDSLVAQTHRPLEVVVVDDGSTDETPTLLARRADVVTIRQPNRGVAAARNAGMAAARGDLLAFLDSDDTCDPAKIACQVAYLDRHPEHAAVLTESDVFGVDDDGAPPWWTHVHPAYADRPGYTPASMMIRRAVVDGVGGQTESMRLGEDLDWLMRIKATGATIGYLREVLYHRRYHGGNATADPGDLHRGLFDALGHHMRRRRGGGETHPAR